MYIDWQGWETSRNLQICYLMHAWDEKKVVQHMKEANKVLLSFMFFFQKVMRFIVMKLLLQNLLYAPTTIIYVCFFFMGIKILDFYTRLFVFVLHTIVSYFSCLTRCFYSTRTLIWIYKKKASLQVSFYNFLETFVCQFKRLVNSKNK